MKLVLKKLRENDLFLKAKKCKFEKTKIESHYSDLAKPLTNLTKKDRKFEWTEGCQQAFEEMIYRRTSTTDARPQSTFPNRIGCIQSCHWSCLNTT